GVEPTNGTLSGGAIGGGFVYAEGGMKKATTMHRTWPRVLAGLVVCVVGATMPPSRSAGAALTLASPFGDRTVLQRGPKACDGGEEEAKHADRFQRLRLCTVAKGSNAKPQTAADVKWRPASDESARDFSGVAFFFAAELLKDPALADVPIGVIDSSFGGTTC